jgi:signal transduction histidine kinase
MSLEALEAVHNPHRLEALRCLCLLDTPTDPSFDRLTQLAASVLHAPVALVSLVDVNRQFFKSQIGLPEPWATIRETPLSHSFCQHVVATGTPLIIEDARKHPLVRENLAIRDLNVIAYAGIPLITSDGDVLGSFCAIHDVPHHWTQREIEIITQLTASVMTEIELLSEIRERKEAQAAVQVALEREKELSRLKSRFVAVTSHELRTPLTVIRSSAALLHQYSDKMSEERREEHFNRIDGQINHLIGLLNDILTIGKVESTGLDFSPTPIDMEALCRELVEEIKQTTDKHQVLLSVHGIPRPYEGDAKLIQCAISNLLSNAIKYSPQGGSVRLHLQFEPKMLLINVSDEGIGMEAKDQVRIFEAFYRAENGSRIQGTGLGLAIVKGIVERHNGTITCTSVLNEGTTFNLYLPA